VVRWDHVPTSVELRDVTRQMSAAAAHTTSITTTMTTTSGSVLAPTSSQTPGDSSARLFALEFFAGLA